MPFRILICCAVTCLSTLIMAAKPAPKPVRILMVGDSTMATRPLEGMEDPQQAGWGQFFGDRFASQVKVINRASSGRSSKSFIKEGRWPKALEANPDFVFIQFGHNDVPGKAERTTDPNGDFRDYLRQYISESKAAGAQPVLVTPVARRTFEDGKITSTLIPYVEATIAVGQETGVPVIDLNASSTKYFEAIGDEAGTDLNCCEPKDRTHFSIKGAKAIAGLVADEIPAKVPGLKSLLKDVVTPTSPVPETAR